MAEPTLDYIRKQSLELYRRICGERRYSCRIPNYLNDYSDQLKHCVRTSLEVDSKVEDLLTKLYYLSYDLPDVFFDGEEFWQFIRPDVDALLVLSE